MTNPILQREFFGILRSSRALAVQVGMVVVVGVVVVLHWPDQGRVDMGGAQAGRVFRLFGYGLLAAIVLLLPVFPATGIVRERSRGTLALLLNSPLSATSIVLGKLGAVVLFVGVLLLLSTPGAAACFAMGGIDPVGGLGAVYLVLSLLAIQYASVGLLVSSYASSTDSALRLVYFVVLAASVFTLVPYMLVGSQTWASSEMIAAARWLRCISPIPAMSEAVGDTAAFAATGGDGGHIWRFVITSTAFSFTATAWTIARLRPTLLDHVRDAGRVTDERSRSVRAWRRFMFLWFFDPKRRSGLIGSWTNPVMVKEQRCRRFGRGNWTMRLIGGCFLVSLALVLAALQLSIDNGVGTIGGVMVSLQIALVLVLTPSLAAGLISAERESGGWQLLQMTPLSIATIVFGKLASAAATLVLVLLATLPAYAVLVLIDPTQLQVTVNVIGTLLLTAIFALLLSAAISSLSDNTAAATATAYGVLITLVGGTMLFWLGEGVTFAPSLVERVLVVNPLATALSLLDTPSFARYDLRLGNWLTLAVLSVVALAVLFVNVARMSRPR